MDNNSILLCCKCPPNASNEEKFLCIIKELVMNWNRLTKAIDEYEGQLSLELEEENGG